MSLSWLFRMTMPIVGYGNNVVNTLRIWDAEADHRLSAGFI